MTTAAELIKSLKDLTAKLEMELAAPNSRPAADQEFALQVAFLAVRHYAETHPRPLQVNQGQAAEMLGVSTATVRKMLRFGSMKLNACGLIPITEIDRALASGPDLQGRA